MVSQGRSIEDTAVAWLQKREFGPWSEQDHAHCAQWLEASTANRVTFLRLEAAWEEMARLKAVAPGFPAGTIPTPEQLQLTSGVANSPAPPRRSILPARWAWAATVLLAATASLWYWNSTPPSYHTPVGGLTTVPLADGSNVTLNTGSRIRVQVEKTRRHVELTAGEAFFDVARDPSRPFTVNVGDRTVTVLGTAFSVRREANDVQVIVTEGKVSVSQAGAPPLAPATVLAAGHLARTSGGDVAVQRKPLAELEDALSWRSGYLVFQDTPLPGVVAEFNRYNQRQLVIDDAAMDSIRLTGKFRSTNVDALTRLLEKSFRVQARREGDRIALSRVVPPAS